MGGVDEFARWALESEQHKTYAQIASLLQPMLESFAQFRRMQNCADEAGSYRCLRNEGFVTWRNNVRPAHFLHFNLASPFVWHGLAG